MVQPKDLSRIYTAIVIAFIFIIAMFVFFWQASFFTKKITDDFKQCNAENITLCITEEECQNKNLFWYDNSCHLIEKPEPKPSKYPDWDSTKSMKSLEIVPEFITFTPDGEVKLEYQSPEVVLRDGKISKGYLEVKASIDGKPLTQWESVYIKVFYDSANHIQYGGHLFRPESLPVPDSEITHLLYSLNEIPYLRYAPYSERKTPSYTNWFNIINSNTSIPFTAFISSLNPAKIESIKIFYKCSPDTPSCELSLKENVY